MVRFTKEERKEISGKLMDAGNLIFAAVTFGQAFTVKETRVLVAVLGIALFLLFYILAMVIQKRR